METLLGYVFELKTPKERLEDAMDYYYGLNGKNRNLQNFVDSLQGCADKALIDYYQMILVYTIFWKYENTHTLNLSYSCREVYPLIQNFDETLLKDTPKHINKDFFNRCLNKLIEEFSKNPNDPLIRIIYAKILAHGFMINKDVDKAIEILTTFEITCSKYDIAIKYTLAEIRFIGLNDISGSLAMLKQIKSDCEIFVFKEGKFKQIYNGDTTMIDELLTTIVQTSNYEPNVNITIDDIKYARAILESYIIPKADPKITKLINYNYCVYVYFRVGLMYKGDDIRKKEPIEITGYTTNDLASIRDYIIRLFNFTMSHHRHKYLASIYGQGLFGFEKDLSLAKEHFTYMNTADENVFKGELTFEHELYAEAMEYFDEVNTEYLIKSHPLSFLNKIRIKLFHMNSGCCGEIINMNVTLDQINSVAHSNKYALLGDIYSTFYVNKYQIAKENYDLAIFHHDINAIYGLAKLELCQGDKIKGILLMKEASDKGHDMAKAFVLLNSL